MPTRSPGPLSLTAAALAHDVMPCGCIRTRLLYDDPAEFRRRAEAAALRVRVLAALGVRE